ncbi:MAG: ribonuclease P protein component [Acidobacteria bacterium]|nr:ribonuclease P protein component [Candidatus Sulfomarinibacter kjeldsenii]
MLSEQRFHFPAKARLKRRADFQRVYKDGARAAGRHVVVFLMRAEAHEGRFGVTASRRVGGAVVRSRCKRRLRELYRTHRHEFDGFPADTVINARRSCASVPWSELEQDFLASVHRALKIATQESRPG